MPSKRLSREQLGLLRELVEATSTKAVIAAVEGMSVPAARRGRKKHDPMDDFSVWKCVEIYLETKSGARKSVQAACRYLAQQMRLTPADPHGIPWTPSSATLKRLYYKQHQELQDDPERLAGLREFVADFPEMIANNPDLAGLALLIPGRAKP